MQIDATTMTIHAHAFDVSRGIIGVNELRAGYEGRAMVRTAGKKGQGSLKHLQRAETLRFVRRTPALRAANTRNCQRRAASVRLLALVPLYTRNSIFWPALGGAGSQVVRARDLLETRACSRIGRFS